MHGCIISGLRSINSEPHSIANWGSPCSLFMATTIATCRSSKPPIWSKNCVPKKPRSKSQSSPKKFTTCSAGAIGSGPTAPSPNSSTADCLPRANGNKPAASRFQEAQKSPVRRLKARLATDQSPSPRVSRIPPSAGSPSAETAISPCESASATPPDPAPKTRRSAGG